MIRLEDTSGGLVSAAIARERHRMGAAATGMVLTLIIMADEDTQADATSAAVAAARLHPMRILTVVPRPDDRVTRLDAEISVGGDEGPGEVAILRLRARLAEHANSVVVPLLLSDTPVVAFWPGQSPAVPADDPIGRHAQRRITDAAACVDPIGALQMRRAGYRPGDTDLSWARLTPWRSILASVFDHPVGVATSAVVTGEGTDPSAVLMAAWLRDRLRIPVEMAIGSGPDLTSIAVATRAGVVRVERIDDHLALLERPDAPPSRLPLPPRDLHDLLAEELRRLDPDEAYRAVVSSLSESTAT
jgi:glucose-6-phosphate dehydrogenase assembly protein OpcA